MSDKPIIFSAESVRAILAGDKTMTRRVVKLTDFKPSDAPGYDWSFRDRRGCWNDVSNERLMGHYCPYEVGDRLWVREAITRHSTNYVKDTCTYLADYTPVMGTGAPEYWCGRAVWQWPKLKTLARSPRWAARLFLEVTSKRAERLQDISEADAKAEGSKPYIDPFENIQIASAVDGYVQSWDRLNAKRSYPWEQNNWVWVYGFKVAQP